MRTAVQIIRSLESSGHRLKLDEAGTIRVRPAISETAVRQLRLRKPELVEELRRREEQQRRAALASEWRVDCTVFTLAASNLGGDIDLACCLQCGASFEAHGRPPESGWRVVADMEVESVENIAARFVRAAESIVREARRK